MKEFFIKIGKCLLVVLSGFLLGVLAVFGFRKKSNIAIKPIDVAGGEEYAQLVKEKAKADILAQSCNVVASEFECVGQSIDRGKKRFRDSVKTLLHSKRVR